MKTQCYQVFFLQSMELPKITLLHDLKSDIFSKNEKNAIALKSAVLWFWNSGNLSLIQ